MIVKELIIELQKVDQEAEVFTEGCDCNGEVDSVDANTAGQVCLMRPREQDAHTYGANKREFWDNAK